VRPARPNGHGASWEVLLEHEERIQAWVRGGDGRVPLSIVKIEELLARSGCAVGSGFQHRPAAGRSSGPDVRQGSRTAGPVGRGCPHSCRPGRSTARCRAPSGHRSPAPRHTAGSARGARDRARGRRAVVPHRTLHRFGVERCGFGVKTTTVRVADGEPGVSARSTSPRWGWSSIRRPGRGGGCTR
jgi:hypothetical protein